jgi:hypothetical protein
MADKKAKGLRTSNKDSAKEMEPVEVVKSDEELRTAYLEGKRKEAEASHAERLRTVKFVCSFVVFLAGMGIISVYGHTFHIDLHNTDDVHFMIYVGLYVVMIIGTLFVGFSKAFEIIASPLADVMDFGPDVKSVLLMSVIKENGFREKCLAVAQFPFDRTAFGVDPFEVSVVDNALMINCVFYEFASNRYCTITPCSIPWSDFCWWDEPRRIREIGTRLNDAFRTFQIVHQ